MQTQTNRISRYMLWHNAEFTLTDDRAALDMTYLHAFLTNSYWAQVIPLETVIKSLDNSLCFGLWHGQRQIGFGRAIADRATLKYHLWEVARRFSNAYSQPGLPGCFI